MNSKEELQDAKRKLNQIYNYLQDKIPSVIQRIDYALNKMENGEKE